MYIYIYIYSYYYYYHYYYLLLLFLLLSYYHIIYYYIIIIYYHYYHYYLIIIILSYIILFLFIIIILLSYYCHSFIYIYIYIVYIIPFFIQAAGVGGGVGLVCKILRTSCDTFLSACDPVALPIVNHSEYSWSFGQLKSEGSDITSQHGSLFVNRLVHISTNQSLCALDWHRIPHKYQPLQDCKIAKHVRSSRQPGIFPNIPNSVS